MYHIHTCIAALSVEPAPSLTAAPLQLRRSPRGSEKRTRTAAAADAGNALSMSMPLPPSQPDAEPAIGEMVECWRVNCHVFEFGKGSREDKNACGKCEHFAALPGAPVTDGTAAA
jgi:hypothetical protein